MRTAGTGAGRRAAETSAGAAAGSEVTEAGTAVAPGERQRSAIAAPARADGAEQPASPLAAGSALATGGGPTGPAAPSWARRRADWLAVALLVLIPLAIDVPPALAGHPLVGGDNLYQNLPLRVLSGRLLAGGHLPLWDPYIWSGTPLLAGWNAGALFPGTWLFAVMPAVGAWTANLVLTSVLASGGTYAFVRRLGCGPLASLLAGLVFAYAGFMSGQQVHIGLVEGTALLPWLLLGLEGLAGSTARRSTAGWMLLVAAAAAGTVLAGEPRAISTSAIAVALYLLAWLLRSPARTVRRLLPAALVAGLCGAALSALQWIPGLGFVGRSQRGSAQVQAALFSVGSLSLEHIASLLTVPFLAGTNGNFGLIDYQGSLNLPEVTIGVGLVALAAALAYLPAVAGSMWRYAVRVVRPGDSERGAGTGLLAGEIPRARRLGVWYVTGAVGVLLTLGSDTRLGGWLVHLPLYGGQRLQNRNAELIDLALVVLLAFFVDDLAGRARAAEPVWRPLKSRTSRALALLSPLAVIATAVTAGVAPQWMAVRIEMPGFQPDYFYRHLSDYLLWSVAAAASLALFLLVASRLSIRWRRLLVATFVLVDVATFALDAAYAAPPLSSFNASTPEARAVQAAADGGRSAIYDPLFSYPPTAMGVPDRLGVTDLNILQGTSSVEGYGSIVSGSYQDLTDTHGFEVLAANQLPGDVFDVTDLRALLTFPVYIWQPIARTASPPVDGVAPTASTAAAPPMASGPYVLAPGASETFVMAHPFALVRATAILDPQAAAAPAALRIAEGDRMPASTHATRVHNGLAVVGFPAHRVVGSVTIENPSPVAATIGAVTIVTRDPAQRYVLDGDLQGELAPPHWRFAGTIDPLSIFVNSRAAGRAWLQPSTLSSPSTTERVAGGRVTVRRTALGAPVEMLVESPRPAELVRSEAYARGWSATVTSLGPGGRSRTEPASDLGGLLQMVRLPAGKYLVSWHYRPQAVVEGELASLAGLLGALVLAAVAWPPGWPAPRRRRRVAPPERVGEG